jgi:hypothetical protein
MWYWIVGRNAPSRSIQRKAGGKKRQKQKWQKLQDFSQ